MTEKIETYFGKTMSEDPFFEGQPWHCKIGSVSCLFILGGFLCCLVEPFPYFFIVTQLAYVWQSRDWLTTARFLVFDSLAATMPAGLVHLPVVRSCLIFHKHSIRKPSFFLFATTAKFLAFLSTLPDNGSSLKLPSLNLFALVATTLLALQTSQFLWSTTGRSGSTGLSNSWLGKHIPFNSLFHCFGRF